MVEIEEGGVEVFGVVDESECETEFCRIVVKELPEAGAVGEPHAPALKRFPIEIDGKLTEIGLPGSFLASLGTVGTSSEETGAGAPVAAPGDVLAPFAGTLSSWSVEDGAEVAEGDTIAVLEAMKMEVPVKAPASGRLTQHTSAGSDVAAKAVIGTIA